MRLMRKLGASRREFFDTIDRPALLPLPTEPYTYAEWRRCRVAPDYHIEVHGHFYSVPSRLIREVVEARITDTTIEIFYRGTRVASHAFSPVRNRHTTIPQHMPSAAPALRRVDARTPDAGGREDRAGNARFIRGNHAGEAASRAGVPRLPRHSAARQGIWRRAAPCRPPARAKHTRPPAPAPQP